MFLIVRKQVARKSTRNFMILSKNIGQSLFNYSLTYNIIKFDGYNSLKNQPPNLETRPAALTEEFHTTSRSYPTDGW